MGIDLPSIEPIYGAGRAEMGMTAPIFDAAQQ
jgi:hypothetical protein